jgi:protein tyrosine phosphatase
MNKQRQNGGRRISKRPRLAPLNIGQFTCSPKYCPEVQNSQFKYNYSSSPSSYSPGSASPAKIHDNCNVYLGSEADALDENFISSEKITTVLSIQSWEIQKKIDGITYEFVQANDNSEQDLKSKFEYICNFLKKHENERVLVHCQAGISRSATACLAYLMKETNQSLETCFSELRKRREIVNPNFAFLGQLKCWEREIMVQ